MAEYRVLLFTQPVERDVYHLFYVPFCCPIVLRGTRDNYMPAPAYIKKKLLSTFVCKARNASNSPTRTLQGREIAKKRGRSMAQIALAWSMGHPVRIGIHRR